MLSPEAEISPVYLKTLRRTLNEIILPEIASPAARDAVKLCDLVLLRMIASLSTPPPNPPPQAGEGRGWDAYRLCETALAEAARLEETEAHIARLAAAEDAPPRTFKVTREAIQTYLQQRFHPDAPHVREMHQLHGGRSKITLMLTIEPYPALPTEIVLRFDNPGSAQRTSVADEFPILQAVHDGGAPAPAPLWLEADPEKLGAPFLAMRRMAGAVTGGFWDAGAASPALGLALADALAALHRIRADRVWPVVPGSTREGVGRMIADLEARWHGAARVTSVTMACAFGWLKRHLDCIDGPAACIHGDVHFGNVLAEGDRLTCLTDWEFCHVGHAAEDLAFCRAYIERIMPWPDFLWRYQAAGGAPVTTEQLRFFTIWGGLRNVTFAAVLLAKIGTGAVLDAQSLSIALHSRAKLEAGLAEAVSAALGGDALCCLYGAEKGE